MCPLVVVRPLDGEFLLQDLATWAGDQLRSDAPSFIFMAPHQPLPASRAAQESDD